MKNHIPTLFKTTTLDSNVQTTHYGFNIYDFKIELAYVERFTRKAWNHQNWKCETLYNSQTMQNIPSNAIVPDEVQKDAERYLRGLVIEVLTT